MRPRWESGGVDGDLRCGGWEVMRSPPTYWAVRLFWFQLCDSVFCSDNYSGRLRTALVSHY